MVVTVFRSRLRESAREDYATDVLKISRLAESMPGFVSIKDFVAEDGERVAIIEFESEATQAAWREHPDHVRAQAAGRERFFSEYTLHVCSGVRTETFGREG